MAGHAPASLEASDLQAAFHDTLRREATAVLSGLNGIAYASVAPSVASRVATLVFFAAQDAVNDETLSFVARQYIVDTLYVPPIGTIHMLRAKEVPSASAGGPSADVDNSAILAIIAPPHATVFDGFRFFCAPSTVTFVWAALARCDHPVLRDHALRASTELQAMLARMPMPLNVLASCGASSVPGTPLPASDAARTADRVAEGGVGEAGLGEAGVGEGRSERSVAAAAADSPSSEDAKANAELRAKLVELETAHGALQAQHASLAAERDAHVGESEAARQKQQHELEQCKDALDAARAERDVAHAERDAARAEKDTARSALDMARRDASVAKKKAQQAERAERVARAALNQHAEELRAARGAMRRAEDDARATAESARAENDALCAERDALLATIRTLRADNEAMRAPGSPSPASGDAADAASARDTARTPPKKKKKKKAKRKADAKPSGQPSADAPSSGEMRALERALGLAQEEKKLTDMSSTAVALSDALENLQTAMASVHELAPVRACLVRQLLEALDLSAVGTPVRREETMEKLSSFGSAETAELESSIQSMLEDPLPCLATAQAHAFIDAVHRLSWEGCAVASAMLETLRGSYAPWLASGDGRGGSSATSGAKLKAMETRVFLAMTSACFEAARGALNTFLDRAADDGEADVKDAADGGAAGWSAPAQAPVGLRSGVMRFVRATFHTAMGHGVLLHNAQDATPVRADALTRRELHGMLDRYQAGLLWWAQSHAQHRLHMSIRGFLATLLSFEKDRRNARRLAAITYLDAASALADLYDVLPPADAGASTGRSAGGSKGSKGGKASKGEGDAGTPPVFLSPRAELEQKLLDLSGLLRADGVIEVGGRGRDCRPSRVGLAVQRVQEACLDGRRLVAAHPLGRTFAKRADPSTRLQNLSANICAQLTRPAHVPASIWEMYSRTAVGRVLEGDVETGDVASVLRRAVEASASGTPKTDGLDALEGLRYVSAKMDGGREGKSKPKHEDGEGNPTSMFAWFGAPSKGSESKTSPAVAMTFAADVGARESKGEPE